VTIAVDSSTIPRRERLAYINAMARDVVPVELDFADDDPLVRGTITDLGPIRVTSIVSNAKSVERIFLRADDDVAPSLMLGMQTSGSSLLVQDGREVVVRTGDLCVYRSTAPYTLADGDGYRQAQVRMPLDRLAIPSDTLRRITATRLTPGHPVADLASAYIRRLTSSPHLFDHARSDLVANPTLELVRAVIGTHLDQAALAAEPMNTTLLLRILEFVRTHLHDPGLNAQQIASEHHISIRHLYNVLAEGGIALGDWIRSRRLEGCHEQLARPSSRAVPIAAVAHQWGFRDASNFGRHFRSAYGMSPREWRDQAASGRPA
jgi:AraC-like DNA-binding protein